MCCVHMMCSPHLCVRCNPPRNTTSFSVVCIQVSVSEPRLAPSSVTSLPSFYRKKEHKGASLPCGPQSPRPGTPAVPYLHLAGAEAGVGPGLRQPAGAVQAGAVSGSAGICRWEERAAMRSGTVIGAQWREEAHLTPTAQRRVSQCLGPRTTDLLAVLQRSSRTVCEGPASRVRWPEHLPWHQQLRRSSAGPPLALRPGPPRGQSRS